MSSQLKLYLASASPRRKELLSQIEADFSILRIHVEELRQENETPKHYVQRLARDKALAGLSSISESALAEPALVLGADTIVVQAGRVFEKPKDEQDARLMLQSLSAQSHEVLTAVCIATSHAVETVLVSTQVSFCAISDAQISAYWQTGEPADKAGAYGIQGLGGQFVRAINGSYSSVVGLPLVETRELLAKFR